MKFPSLSRSTLVYFTAALAVCGLLGASLSHAADKDAPQWSIKEVMKMAHKGDTALIRRASKGEATNAEMKQLLEYYKAMAVQKPPQGDMASWTEKCTAIIAATERMVKGDAAALPDFKKATNCKSCHSVHRPEEKK